MREALRCPGLLHGREEIAQSDSGYSAEKVALREVLPIPSGEGGIAVVGNLLQPGKGVCSLGRAMLMSLPRP